MKKTTKIIAMLMSAALLISSLTIASYAVSGNVPKDIIASSSKVAVELEQEGIVLLKNEENVLPLSGKKVNIFGAGSVSPFLGGAGSGAITTDDPVLFYEALDESNIEYNKELRTLYEKECSSNDMPKTGNTVVNNLLQLALAKNTLKELDSKMLTDELIGRAVSFSDTAIIVISRTSAEGSDLSPKVLRLYDQEKALVEKVTANFANVIVLFNTGNVMEMGWLNEYSSIKAAAMIWIPGEFGMRAVAQMLKGDINPSGRLTDTVAFSVEDHPSSKNFGTYEYDGGGYYVEYQEGIYVGYRYFETFAKDKVQYPFGHGLSYTAFKKELVDHRITDEKISVDVKVTNIGSVAGKETVQIYYSAPYTDGEIEKSAICLAGYKKVSLEPNESKTVTVEFEIDSMMSYDKNNREAWVLERGDYEIILGENARDSIDSFTYTVENEIIKKFDEVTGAQIKNLFDFAYSDFSILSRKNASETYPASRKLTANDEIKKPDELPSPVKDGVAPITNAKYSDGVITLQQVAASPELMDKFLDQLTVDEMIKLVAHGGYETQGIERLGIPKTYDNDGPSCVKGPHGQTYFDCGAAYPCATAIACTWNNDLAYRMGESAGIEADAMQTDIWYAPGANIHRNPMGGRNFEYFSEDPLLSGNMAASIVAGAKSKNLITTVKHFALNDQESHRNGIFTWADEQAMREIYLKAFEIPVKEADCDGIMSAYNRIGTNWCGGCSELLNDLLRTEWGYDGFVISDFSSNFTGSGYMNPVLGVYNGNDLMLTGFWLLSMPSHTIAMKLAYQKDPIGFGTALRKASKNVILAKMKTNAFLNPVEDAPYLLDLFIKPSEWDFTKPILVSPLKYVFANVVNAFVLFVRVIMQASK